MATKPHVVADPALERARSRLAAGDLAGARRECSTIIERGDPKRAAAAHLLLAACATRAGDPPAARAHVDAALRLDAQDPLAHYAFAELAERAGDVDAAIASLERAVALQPSLIDAHQRLGILYGERGHASRAADAFARVVALDPRNARGYNNLGNALRSLGRDGDALAAFERAVALQPDYELAIANVAVMWRDAGEIERAEALLQSVMKRPRTRPPLRAIVVMLAGLLRERGALDEALPLYEQAIAMAPSGSAPEWFNLGRVYAERDELDRARDAYRTSYASDRSDLRAAIASRMSLPMIYESMQHLRESRDRYAAGLNELHDIADTLVGGLPCERVLDGLRWTNFFLAYQGADDRALQASYGRLVSRLVDQGAPMWRDTAREYRPGSKLRVGFASAFFHVGTAGRYFRSWLTGLDRERFEVFVYHLYPGLDDIAREINARADRFVEFGGSRARPSVIAPAIRDDALDVLVYPELGMDHTSFALAALRLAPRQLAGWGHPVTSGHATIDGFVTCADMESQDARQHYVEPLLKLPGIGTSYRRPDIPKRPSRARFGLPDGRVLLLCPQSLFKVHPDNDELFARVLAANPTATLVMFDGRHPNVTARFTRRLTDAFDAHGLSARERVAILPALPHDDYLRVNLVCDAMLDTLHWSGGNTTIDALACGLPVVTLPGAYMRGRQSAAMLRIVGADALIARDERDYVGIATRLAGDRAWRGSIARTIRDNGAALFNRDEPVRAFADLLLALR